MAEFNIRADSVNVEDIMRQIRARIREKRGVDYTEQQIRELAAVKLERMLDPDKVRSELLQQFRSGEPAPKYEFEERTLFETHRPVLRLARRILRPVLKLFFNPDQITYALHIQTKLNDRFSQHATLSYEVLHNLVVELTRLGIEVKNLKMRVESLSSRLDFAERRARALEGVVQYRPGTLQASLTASSPASEPGSGNNVPGGREAEGLATESRSRRRRRRRGRRGGQPAVQPAEGEAAGGASRDDSTGEAGPPAPDGTDAGAARDAGAPPADTGHTDPQ